MSRRTRKVLLIDDNPAITRLLSHMLRQEGLRVVESNDADTAVARVAQEKPDLVILDICMPRLDGWAVCRQIRQEGWRMPILVLTVLSEPQDVERTYQCGASAHMAKPFSTKELLQCVHALLAQAGERRKASGKVDVSGRFSADGNVRPGSSS